MNAKEARKLTEIYLHPDTDALFALFDQRIEDAAKRGHSYITEPEIGHPGIQVTLEQRRALREYYESRGFKWQDSTKAGHSCCFGLTTISW